MKCIFSVFTTNLQLFLLTRVTVFARPTNRILLRAFKFRLLKFYYLYLFYARILRRSTSGFRNRYGVQIHANTTRTAATKFMSPTHISGTEKVQWTQRKTTANETHARRVVHRRGRSGRRFIFFFFYSSPTVKSIYGPQGSTRGIMIGAARDGRVDTSTVAFGAAIELDARAHAHTRRGW